MLVNMLKGSGSDIKNSKFLTVNTTTANKVSAFHR